MEKKSPHSAIIIVVIVAVIVVGFLQLRGPDSAARGEALYLEHCVACHGVRGVGENPADKYARDKYGFVAPPLDDTGHAWHHPDADLKRMIMEGSPRNPRMAAFKHVLSENDAQDVIEYIKSLWSPYIRENCQGPKHMQCM